MHIPRVIISAPQRSSGKTTISIGLSRALSKRGIVVQPFKKGPDYIDSMWLSAASGRSCYNLDYFMMGEQNILSSFVDNSIGSNIAVIEGNQSLYDGIDLEGTGSTARLSRLLGSPVVLVINAKGLNRGIAPIVSGLINFETDVNIAGVILNKVSGLRHENKLKQAINHYCNIEVLGSIPNEVSLTIKERHLGLVPSKENNNYCELIDLISIAADKYINLDRILEIANTISPLLATRSKAVDISSSRVKIAVAKDKAFSFYYPENLRSLEAAGAELIFFDTITDKQLPKVNGIYIGGGFPEALMDELEANLSMRRDILNAIEDGIPVYAECGGLIYLSRSITWNGINRKMVGSLPCDIEMHSKPKGHGYVILKATNNNSWFRLDGEVPAHEFHYSHIKTMDKGVDFAFKMVRGYGIDGQHDGIIYKNLLASYTHIHSISTPNWASSFIKFIEEVGYKK